MSYGLQCDYCTEFTPHKTGSDPDSRPDSWWRITHTKKLAGAVPAKVTRDFCSQHCLIQWNSENSIEV